MKANIHPKYNEKIVTKCACGTTFETGSTLPDIQVEICSACHPFFTGEMRFVDTMGRVEKFRVKAAQASGTVSKKKKKQQKVSKNEPKSLKEMLSSS